VKVVGGVDSGFDLAGFVRASCERSGVPVKVADVLVTAQVASLLTGRPSRVSEADPGGQTGSDAPNQIDALRLEGPAADLGGCDHGMVEHGAHDCVLTVEAEFGPLCA